jgi:hypothetical protein
MIEGRKEKPPRREEVEKERNAKFSFWGEILALVYLLFEKIRNRKTHEETTENSTEGATENSNNPIKGEPEGVTRRWVITRLFPAALLTLAGCLPPEERETRFNYPIVEQAPPPPLSKEIRSVQDFVDTYAEDFLKPYAHDDQILLHLNDENRVDEVTYISNVLNERTNRVEIRGRTIVVIEPRNDPLNITLRKLINSHHYFNQPIQIEFIEIEIGGQRYLMPSSWIKGSLRNSLNARLFQLTSNEEAVIMNFYKGKIMENQMGIELNIDENAFKNATVNIRQRPDIQQVLKNGIPINENENTKLFYENALTKSFKNADVALFEYWKGNRFTMKVIELRSIHLDGDTTSLGRFMIVARNNNNNETHLFVVSENSTIGRLVRNSLGHNLMTHHILRHSIDYPKDSLWGKIRTVLNDNQIEGLINLERNGARRVKGIEFRVVEIEQSLENLKIITVEASSGGKKGYLQIMWNPRRNFGTWYPLSNEFLGTSVDEQRIRYLRHLDFSSTLQKIRSIEDPTIRFALGSFAFSVLTFVFLENKEAKDKLTMIISKNQSLFQDILNKYINEGLLEKGATFYVGIGEWLIEVRFRKKDEASLTNTEFGSFVTSRLFTIDGFVIGNNEIELVCQRLEPDEKLIKDNGGTIIEDTNINPFPSSLENLNNKVLKIFNKNTAFYEYYGIFIPKQNQN